MTLHADAGFLERMAQTSRKRVEERRAAVPFDAVEQRATACGALPRLTLDPAGFDVIAEVKLRSPSEGSFEPAGGGRQSVEERVAAQTRLYAQAGAAAISVLTEPTEFRGSLSYLARASDVTATPVMRKDFIVDPYQILEGRAAGASGVLLIVRILDDAELVHMAEVAREVGMFSLIECFDVHDADRVAALWPSLSHTGPDGSPAPAMVGVNCRDLTTLNVEFDRLGTLAPRLPDAAIKVAESGLLTAEHARHVAACGYSMALVGSALMRAEDPGGLLSEMVVAGREEVTCASA